MNWQRKNYIEKLLEGYKIAALREDNIRLRDQEHRSVDKIDIRTFRWMKSNLLRREKSGLYVIDKRLVRSMHGNSIVKKLYKNFLHNGKS